MTPHSELFAEDFHAYSVAENYPEKEVTVDLEGFYKGYDEGKVFSHKCILLLWGTSWCWNVDNFTHFMIQWHFYLSEGKFLPWLNPNFLCVSPENEWLESGFNKESKDQPRYT